MPFLLALFLAGALIADPKGDALLKQAQAHLAAGNYAAVIEEARQAAAIYRAAGDSPGLSRALTGMGYGQLSTGDYPRALASFSDALSLAQQSRDHLMETESLNNIGAVLYEQGSYSAAMERYQEALLRTEDSKQEAWAPTRRNVALANIAMVHETLGQYQLALDDYVHLLDTPQQMPQVQAQLLANIGTLRRRMGDPVKAMEAYRQAQLQYKKSSRLDGEIGVLTNIGIAQALDFKDLNSAAATFTDAVHLADRSGNRPQSIQARVYRGEAEFRAGRLGPAGEDFEAALTGARALGKTDEVWKAQYGLARIALAQGRVDNGRRLVQEAIAAIEGLRSGLREISQRPEFLADKRDVYDLATTYEQDPEEIFRLLEKSRGRFLRDRNGTVFSSLQSLSGGIPEDTAILEYWLKTDGFGGVLSIAHGRWEWTRLSLGAEARAALLELPSLLDDPRQTSWRSSAQALARELLPQAGIWNQPGIRRLAIVADGGLYNIPFEVLPVSGSQLMIQKLEVSYLTSAGSFQKGDSGRSFGWPWKNSFVALADPSPNESAKGFLWPQLPQARREVTGIASYLKSAGGVHVGSDATRNYLSQVPRAGVLHLATHAVADSENPAKSVILLASSMAGERYDAFYLREVYNLPLKGLWLATLSACETNVGKQVNGEGVESFRQAFLAAGARSVVSSLWRVNDTATADLMLGFYGRLAAGSTKAEALREAKLAFLADPQRSHPAYWAAFLLSGESSSRLPYTVGYEQLALLATALICAGIAIRMRARKA